MLEKQHGIIVGVARVQLPTPIKVNTRVLIFLYPYSTANVVT
jgi:hypothetical protein